MMKKIACYIKKEIVLSAAWVLALISAFFVHPSSQYLNYIDFRSLGILWSLMVIMQMFKENGLFEFIGEKLLQRTKKLWQIITVLVFLCFFFSMLITNDVSLITFVPFTIMILHKCGKTKMLIPVIALQTVAANLGSMLLPIGNPQNLYLYGISDLSFGAFIKLLFPYSLISLLLLCVLILCIKGKNESINPCGQAEKALTKPRTMCIYGGLFLEALLVVARLIPYEVLVFTVLAASLIVCRRILLRVDYALLLTFVGFFIFTGNIGNIPLIKENLETMVTGHELLTGVIASQIISNVPAALLLSGFAGNIKELILGVNFGGLGTLIASMASLISYKLYAAEEGAQRGKYLLYFTVVNLIFLAVLVLFHLWL